MGQGGTRAETDLHLVYGGRPATSVAMTIDLRPRIAIPSIWTRDHRSTPRHLAPVTLDDETTHSPNAPRSD